MTTRVESMGDKANSNAYLSSCSKEEESTARAEKHIHSRTEESKRKIEPLEPSKKKSKWEPDYLWHEIRSERDKDRTRTISQYCLDDYNCAHSTNFILVYPMAWNGFVTGDGTLYYHVNFTAKPSCDGEDVLFFGEFVNFVGVTESIILDDTVEIQPTCYFCYKELGIRHPVGMFHWECMAPCPWGKRKKRHDSDGSSSGSD